MKKYLILYRPFLIFLTKFFLTYLFLTLVYQAYLSSYDVNSVDFITRFVAYNTEQLLRFFQVDFLVLDTPKKALILLEYNQLVVAKMIEGCNSVSVIILFVSFIVAFSGKLKPTLFYVLGGSIFIYALNVIRIGLLCSALYWLPQHKTILHDVVFPLFIYGIVFVLWVVWVNKFSLYAK